MWRQLAATRTAARLMFLSPSQLIVPDVREELWMTLLMNPSSGAYCSCQMNPTIASDRTTGR